MYQAYPGGDQPPAPHGLVGSPPPVPLPVATAVRVMYAGAWASLIGIVIDLVTVHSLQARLVTMTNANGTRLTPAQVTQQEHLAVGSLIVIGVVGIALWIWMARSNRDGRSWARTVSTVIFGIATVGVIGDANGSSALAGTIETRIWGIVVWLIGLAAVILLWRRGSAGYFRTITR
jgi:hypothetical protein